MPVVVNIDIIPHAYLFAREARLSPAGAVATFPYILRQVLICIPIRSREKIGRRSSSTKTCLVLDINSVTTIVAVSSSPSSYPEVMNSTTTSRKAR